MGAKADEKSKTPQVEYLKTFRERKYVEEWVKANGDHSKVYLTEHWINGKRLCAKHTKVICTHCNWKEHETKAFVDKWTWAEYKQIWHRSNYIHESEKL